MDPQSLPSTSLSFIGQELLYSQALTLSFALTKKYDPLFKVYQNFLYNDNIHSLSRWSIICLHYHQTFILKKR